MRNGNELPGGTRSLILEAAEHQFTRYGYSKVTMDEIAAEAGLKKASLYYYFPTKDELYHAVLDRQHADFQAHVEQLLSSSASLGERIPAYVDARYEFFNRLLRLNTLDYRSTVRNRPALRAIFRRYSALELKWLSVLFEEGRKHGEFAVESAPRAAEAFLHVMQGLRARFMRELEDGPASPAAFSQFRRELLYITGVFLAGVSGGPSRTVSTARFKHISHTGR
jgi:TetR/AcrR family transcriptional regulator